MNHSSAVVEGPQNPEVMDYSTGRQEFGENGNSSNVKMLILPRKIVEEGVKRVMEGW